jgi:hypothetical protein
MDIKILKAIIEVKERLLAKDPDMRYAICLYCEHLDKTVKICNKCGCFMPAKTRIKDAECPIKKW